LRATIFLIFNFFLSDAMQDQWWGDMQNIDYQEQNEIQKNKKKKIHKTIGNGKIKTKTEIIKWRQAILHSCVHRIKLKRLHYALIT
jgi:hypothetical protein